MTAPSSTRAPDVDPGQQVAATRSVWSRVGPGPGLVVVALGLLLVGLSARTTPSSASTSTPWLSVTLATALPPVTTGGAAGLGILLAVLLAASFLPRLRDATRVLLSSAALGATGLGLVVLGAAGEGAWPSPSASAVGDLLGLSPARAATVVALLAPVVVHLVVLVVLSLGDAPPRARLIAGSAAGLLVLVVVGVEPIPLAVVVAGAAGLLLVALPVAHLRARREGGTATPAATPGAAAGRRTDLLPAALLAVVAVGAEVSGSATAVGAATAVLAVTAASERLARWRARGQLEVLARCLSGAVLPCVLLGLALRAADPRLWAVGLSVLALAGLVVASRLPRPPTPQYVRGTHVLVVRGVPWALLAGVLVVVALAQPRSSGPVAESANAIVPASSSSRAPSPSAGPSIRLGAMKGTTVEVLVRSPRASGPLEIRTRIGGDDISYPLVWVTADTELSVDVALPAQGRFLVSLNDPTSPTPLQTLVVER